MASNSKGDADTTTNYPDLNSLNEDSEEGLKEGDLVEVVEADNSGFDGSQPLQAPRRDEQDYRVAAVPFSPSSEHDELMEDTQIEPRVIESKAKPKIKKASPQQKGRSPTVRTLKEVHCRVLGINDSFNHLASVCHQPYLYVFSPSLVITMFI